MNALRLLYLRLIAFDRQCRYENIFELHQVCLADLERIRPQLRYAQAELEAANRKVMAAELAVAQVEA